MIRKTELTITSIVFVVTILVTFPVYADCSADIKNLEERVSQLVDSKGGREVKIQRLIDEAKTALKNGKEKKCMAKAKIAKRILDTS